MGEPDDPSPAVIVPARLRWQGDQPFSTRYGDIYHAPDGVAEVLRAFVEPQRLESRFAASRTRFTIGELGFGTGLNCAVAAQRFIERAPQSAQLLHQRRTAPLRSGDFVCKWQAPPHAVPFYDELAPLSAVATGWHRRHLQWRPRRLSLFFGDAYRGLQEIRGRQRAGRCVAARWSCAAAQPRSLDAGAVGHDRCVVRNRTTLATFSAVGAVRRSLADAGFQMRKIDQRPHKRHSLAGIYVGNARDPHCAALRGGRRCRHRGCDDRVASRPRHRRDAARTCAGPTESHRSRGAALPRAARRRRGNPAALRELSIRLRWYDQHAASNRVTGVLQFPAPE
jgi:tRNA 5-methylaminomethyl-2-thiouridine biosynthesis bifunctional protein